MEGALDGGIPPPVTQATCRLPVPSAMTNQQPIVFSDRGGGGMTGDDCVVHVTEALESVLGVETATVDLPTRSAVVTARSDVEASALAQAVRTTGQYNAFERGRRATSGE